MGTWAVGIAAIVLGAAIAFAQQQNQPSAQEALLKKLATPGEHHQRLDPLAVPYREAKSL